MRIIALILLVSFSYALLCMEKDNASLSKEQLEQLFKQYNIKHSKKIIKNLSDWPEADQKNIILYYKNIITSSNNSLSSFEELSSLPRFIWQVFRIDDQGLNDIEPIISKYGTNKFRAPLIKHYVIKRLFSTRFNAKAITQFVYNNSDSSEDTRKGKLRALVKVIEKSTKLLLMYTHLVDGLDLRACSSEKAKFIVNNFKKFFLDINDKSVMQIVFNHLVDLDLKRLNILSHIINDNLVKSPQLYCELIKEIMRCKENWKLDALLFYANLFAHSNDWPYIKDIAEILSELPSETEHIIKHFSTTINPNDKSIVKDMLYDLSSNKQTINFINHFFNPDDYKHVTEIIEQEQLAVLLNYSSWLDALWHGIDSTEKLKSLRCIKTLPIKTITTLAHYTPIMKTITFREETCGEQRIKNIRFLNRLVKNHDQQYFFDLLEKADYAVLSALLYRLNTLAPLINEKSNDFIKIVNGLSKEQFTEIKRSLTKFFKGIENDTYIPLELLRYLAKLPHRHIIFIDLYLKHHLSNPQLVEEILRHFDQEQIDLLLRFHHIFVKPYHFDMLDLLEELCKLPKDALVKIIESPYSFGLSVSDSNEQLLAILRILGKADSSLSTIKTFMHSMQLMHLNWYDRARVLERLVSMREVDIENIRLILLENDYNKGIEAQLIRALIDTPISHITPIVQFMTKFMSNASYQVLLINLLKGISLEHITRIKDIFIKFNIEKFHHPENIFAATKYLLNMLTQHKELVEKDLEKALEILNSHSYLFNQLPRDVIIKIMTSLAAPDIVHFKQASKQFQYIFDDSRKRSNIEARSYDIFKPSSIHEKDAFATWLKPSNVLPHEHRTYLDLSNCPGLVDCTLDHITKNCPNLTHLVLPNGSFVDVDVIGKNCSMQLHCKTCRSFLSYIFNQFTESTNGLV